MRAVLDGTEEFDWQSNRFISASVGIVAAGAILAFLSLALFAAGALLGLGRLL